MNEEFLDRIKTFVQEGTELYMSGVIDVDLHGKRVFMREEQFFDLLDGREITETLRANSPYPYGYETEEDGVTFRCISDKRIEL